MSSQGIRRKKNLKRKEIRTIQREETLLEGEEKMRDAAAIERARANPLSVLGNKVLREERTKREGPETIADCATKKLAAKGMPIPTSPDQLRPKPVPSEYHLELERNYYGRLPTVTA